MIASKLILDSKKLLDEARRRSGSLSDFGDPSFLPGLEKLVAAINGEAEMSSNGLDLFAGRVVESLTQRLILQDYCRRHPEIHDEVISNPAVIIGLPRTGTTMLHRVMAADPRFYTSAWWEVRYPAPLEGETLRDPKMRRERARAEVKMMVEALPQLLSMHPLDADLADEEVLLMEHSFLSAMDAYANIPSYVEWLHQQDQTPAYEYLRKQLQFIQWQKRQRGIRAERWVLKAPHHLHALETLFKVFPDVKVIQTHRDPLQTIPSMASFAHTLWHIYSDKADARAAGRIWSQKFARGLKHAMDVRKQLPEDRFMDVWYLDAVAKPLEVVRNVYPFLGMELTPQVEALMQEWIAKAGRDGRPAHDYSAEKTGLSPMQLELDFAEYRQKYVAPHWPSMKGMHPAR